MNAPRNMKTSQVGIELVRLEITIEGKGILRMREAKGD